MQCSGVGCHCGGDHPWLQSCGPYELGCSLIFNGTYFAKLLQFSTELVSDNNSWETCKLLMYKCLVLMGLNQETWEVGWSKKARGEQQLTLERLHKPGRHLVTVILDCQITRGDPDLLTHPVSKSSAVPAIGSLHVSHWYGEPTKLSSS